MVVLLATLALAAPLEVRTEAIMSTRITVAVPPEHIGEADAVFAVFRQVESTANEWRPGSPLSDVNAAAGGAPVGVPAELIGLLKRGIALGDLTGGAFDITWGALWGLWDFSGESTGVPPMEERRRRAARVDYRRVSIDEEAGAVGLDAGMVIGLGGLAKGHALDRAAALLDARGVGTYSLSAGGQVLVRGLRDGRAWRVGIRDPRGQESDYFGVVEVVDRSVSTSGDYERFFIVDGVRYHHILDPRTGSPPARGLRSATVIAADATTADALSTALMVMGGDRGLALVESLPEVEAVVVDARGEVSLSSGARVAFVRDQIPLR